MLDCPSVPGITLSLKYSRSYVPELQTSSTGLAGQKRRTCQRALLRLLVLRFRRGRIGVVCSIACVTAFVLSILVGHIGDVPRRICFGLPAPSSNTTDSRESCHVMLDAYKHASQDLSSERSRDVG